MENATVSGGSRTQQSVSLSSAEAELGALTTGIVERHGDQHFLKELVREVTLVNHVNSQSAKALASMRGLGRMKHANAGIHVRARCRGE